MFLLFQGNPDYSGILSFDAEFIMNTVFIWLNLAVIIGVLAWLLYKPLLNSLDKRKERIRSEIERSAENLRKSEEAKELYNHKLIGINAERDEILEAARKNAAQREADILAKAEHEAGLMLARANRDIALEWDKSRDEMRTKIIEVSSMLAEQLVEETLDDAAKDRFLNRAIQELGE